MSSSRRRFLSYGLALPSLAWGCRPSGGGAPAATSPEPAPAPEPQAAPIKSVLVLGGTRFLGPAVVDEALAAGLEVTLFNRGKSNPEAYPELETLIGDRDPKVGEGLAALEGRSFDAVIDTSGYFPRHVRASAELLAPRVGQYVFISSISAYATHDHPGDDETAALAQLEDPAVETMGATFQYYGGLKALCEHAAEDAMPGRVSNVRPGYIVGPRDPSDRFTYWPVRIAQGGDVLAPGSADDPLQVIDVRDLGRWLVRLVTTRTTGVFNAVGPAQPMTWGTVLEACTQASDNDARLVWASAEFLEAKREAAGDDAPPLMLPIWAPPSGKSAGFHLYRNARALETGLTFRSIEQTAADTLAWFRTLPEERRKRLEAAPREQEAALLAELATLARGPRRSWVDPLPARRPTRWAAPRGLASAFG